MAKNLFLGPLFFRHPVALPVIVAFPVIVALPVMYGMVSYACFCMLLRCWLRRAGCVSQDAYILHWVANSEQIIFAKCAHPSPLLIRFWNSTTTETAPTVGSHIKMKSVKLQNIIIKYYQTTFTNRQLSPIDNFHQYTTFINRQLSSKRQLSTIDNFQPKTTFINTQFSSVDNFHQ